MMKKIGLTQGKHAVGRFNNINEAIRRRDGAISDLHKEFARTESW